MEHSAHQDTRCHRLVDAFREETGVPVIINTSCNENKLAIIRSREATDCVLCTKMDPLIAGKCMARRVDYAIGGGRCGCAS